SDSEPPGEARPAADSTAAQPLAPLARAVLDTVFAEGLSASFCFFSARFSLRLLEGAFLFLPMLVTSSVQLLGRGPRSQTADGPHSRADLRAAGQGRCRAPRPTCRRCRGRGPAQRAAAHRGRAR